MLKYQTIINSSFIILYYFIACYFFVKFAIGEIKIIIKSKETNEYIELNSFYYFLICLSHSILWPYLLYLLYRGGKE